MLKSLYMRVCPQPARAGVAHATRAATRRRRVCMLLHYTCTHEFESMIAMLKFILEVAIQAQEMAREVAS